MKHVLAFTRPENSIGIRLIEHYYDSINTEFPSEEFEGADLYMLISDDVDNNLMRLYRIINTNITYMMTGMTIGSLTVDSDRYIIVDSRLKLILNTIKEVYTDTYELRNGNMVKS